jgi:hypothetical protein
MTTSLPSPSYSIPYDLSNQQRAGRKKEGEIYQLVERVLVVFIRLVRGTFQPDQAVARIPLLAEEPFPQYHAELEHCRRFAEGGGLFVPGHGALWVLADTGAEFAADY